MTIAWSGMRRAHDACCSWATVPGVDEISVPMPARARWVLRELVVAALVQADSALADELAEALPDTIDEL